MADLVRLSDHPALARAASRPPAALFAADAERREGVDHAGGDRAAVRAALVDIGKDDSQTPEFLSLNPNGKIPAIIDPDGPGGKPLGAVRIRRDPALSRREDRQAPAGRSGAALRDDPVGVLPDGVDRADVRAGRLLPQIRRQGDRGQAAAASAIVDESKRLLGVLETRLDGRAMDHGRRLHHRRHRACSAGCATSSASTARANSSTSTRLKHVAGLAGARPGAAGRAARARRSRSGPEK